MVDNLMGEALARISEAQEAVRMVATDINRGNGGRETALALTKLEEAYMWLREARALSS